MILLVVDDEPAGNGTSDPLAVVVTEAFLDRVLSLPKP